MGAGGGEIHNLLLMDAKDGMVSLLAQQGEMDKGAERAISYEHISRTHAAWSVATWAMSWVCQGAASTSSRKPVPA